MDHWSDWAPTAAMIESEDTDIGPRASGGFSVARLSIKAVVLGVLTDIVVTGIAGLPILIIVAVRTQAVSVPNGVRAQVVLETARNTPSLSVVLLGVRALCSTLGGRVAAKTAQRGA